MSAIIGILMGVIGVIALILAGIESMGSTPSGNAGLYGWGGLALIIIGPILAVWG